ncbi:hypothetical protein GDO81_006188 [Engystomops pustulosus]|uniref:Uncharacterized protein n=1 Tax=Engystomops pustulosus TaxID=76066 RepID=A0AAV7CWP4_ENGPU|nr:hypothetical protein GDO81_006188 [Engystomops pustulosus]
MSAALLFSCTHLFRYIQYCGMVSLEIWKPNTTFSLVRHPENHILPFHNLTESLFLNGERFMFLLWVFSINFLKSLSTCF